MLIKAFEVGQLSTNCYIVIDEKSLIQLHYRSRRGVRPHS